MVHFVRRRPDTFWLWIILIGVWLGAAVYIVAEVVPDAGLLRSSLNVFPRRRRIRELQHILIEFHRAMGLLGHLYARTSQPDRTDAAFRKATDISTLSETYYNCASFLADQHRTTEAREWAARILDKKATMPRYLRRHERPWFRKAAALINHLPPAPPPVRESA